MNNYPPFYVGQRVVALRSHWQGYFEKGEEFIVVGIRKPCCVWVIDVGIPNKHMGCVCSKCGYGEFNVNAWFAIEDFAPISENFQAITLEKVVEVETPLISVN